MLVLPSLGVLRGFLPKCLFHSNPLPPQTATTSSSEPPAPSHEPDTVPGNTMVSRGRLPQAVNSHLKPIRPKPQSTSSSMPPAPSHSCTRLHAWFYLLAPPKSSPRSPADLRHRRSCSQIPPAREVRAEMVNQQRADRAMVARCDMYVHSTQHAPLRTYTHVQMCKCNARAYTEAHTRTRAQSRMCM